MINGVVSEIAEALIQVVVRGPGDREVTIDAILDTGFTGFLALPPVIVEHLGLPLLFRQSVILADGSRRFVNVHAGLVLWDGQPRTIEVDATGTEPLVGMSLLTGFELRMQVRSGGAVTITALP